MFLFYWYGIVLVEIFKRWLISNGWVLIRVNSSIWCDCFKLLDFFFV